MISTFLVILYNLSDTVWVAGLGPSALAAIGFITPLFLILVGLGNGLGVGANSLISRYIGSNNYAKANNAGLHAIVLSITSSIILTIILTITLKPILIIMGVGNTLNYAMEYGTIIFSGLIIFVFSEVALALFRSEGDMKRATYAIAVTAILNIALDPIFIYGFDLGIKGAAWTTIVSATMSCIVIAYWIWGKQDTYLNYNFKNFKWDKEIIMEIFKVGIPSIFENFAISLLVIFVNIMLLMCSGTEAVAVYTAAMKIVQIATIPLVSIAISVITVAGVAYGSRNYKNLEITYKYSLKLGLIISFIIGLIMATPWNSISVSELSYIFTYTSASASISSDFAVAITLLSLLVIVIPLGLMSSMIFQGVGKGINAFIITIIRSLIAECVFAYIFGFIFGFGVQGIYFGAIIGSLLGGIFGYIWTSSFIKKYKKSCIEEEQYKKKIIEST